MVDRPRCRCSWPNSSTAIWPRRHVGAWGWPPSRSMPVRRSACFRWQGRPPRPSERRRRKKCWSEPGGRAGGPAPPLADAGPLRIARSRPARATRSAARTRSAACRCGEGAAMPAGGPPGQTAGSPGGVGGPPAMRHPSGRGWQNGASHAQPRRPASQPSSTTLDHRSAHCLGSSARRLARRSHACGHGRPGVPVRGLGPPGGARSARPVSRADTCPGHPGQDGRP